LGENIVAVKENLSGVIEMLRERPVEESSGRAMRELLTRLQSAQNVLIQNERKIWLRTRVGKEITADIEAASEKLRMTVESGSSLEVVKEALSEVEVQAKRIDEETRRRSMVVT
jgi:hypothetical protein